MLILFFICVRLMIFNIKFKRCYMRHTVDVHRPRLKHHKAGSRHNQSKVW